MPIALSLLAASFASAPPQEGVAPGGIAPAEIAPNATFVVAPVADAEATALSYDGGTLVGSAGGRAFAWRIPDPNRAEIPGLTVGAGAEGGPEGGFEDAPEIRIFSAPGAALALSDDGGRIVGNGLEPHASPDGTWIGSIL